MFPVNFFLALLVTLVSASGTLKKKQCNTSDEQEEKIKSILPGR